MTVRTAARALHVIAGTIVAIAIAVPSYAQEFKAHFVSPLWGLRVQTDTPGGLVGSFGSNGDFVVDAQAIVGGRFAIKENGNVGIGIPNPGQKLSVAGVVESTSGGFKFPDGSIQTSAIASGGSYIQNTTSQQAGANFNIAGSGIIGASLGVGGAAENASRVTVLDASKSYGIHVTTSKVGSTGIYVQSADTGVSAWVSEEANANSAAIVGVALGGAKGVEGDSQTGYGVRGTSVHGTGVSAYSSYGVGINSSTGGSTAIDAINVATSGFSDGVRATTSSGAAVGLWAKNLAPGGTAGRFDGNVAVYGTLTKSGGSFKIDHPLDPENRYLSHSFVESPDMMNIYNGNVTTDADGTAEVTLPLWFQSLNEEFRYQLTCIGTFAQAIIAEEISDNRFVIKTSLPRVKVSWQVTGIRHDPWAEQHRIPVEETKPDTERGSYLHPDAYGQPAERSSAAARSTAAAQGKKN